MRILKNVSFAIVLALVSCGLIFSPLFLAFWFRDPPEKRFLEGTPYQWEMKDAPKFKHKLVLDKKWKYIYVRDDFTQKITVYKTASGIADPKGNFPAGILFNKEDKRSERSFSPKEGRIFYPCGKRLCGVKFRRECRITITTKPL